MTSKAGGVICLWDLGAGPSPAAAIEVVRSQVERLFGLDVVIWAGHERPTHVFDARRGQASSTAILEWLLEHEPAPARKTLAISDMDLFIPILTFVFGEAQLGGRAAVVSTARLVPSNVLPGDHRLFTTRLLKEAAHELGHTFGLVHCSVRECVMSRSASLLEVDAKSARFCSDCWTRYLDQRDHPGGTDE